MTIVNASRGTSKKYVDDQDALRTQAINAETTRAEGIEAGLRTDVDANTAAITAERNRATAAEGALNDLVGTTSTYGTVTQAVLNDAKDYTDTQITQRVTQVYSIQGSCTHAQLDALAALTGTNTVTINGTAYGRPETGNVWNVTDAYGTLGSAGYVPPGTNYVWTGSGWDAMGGTIDLSTYETTSAVNTKLAQYATATKTNTILAQHQNLIKKTQVSLTSNGFNVDGTEKSVTGVTGAASEILIVSPIPSHIEKATNYGLYASASALGKITFKADAAIAANDTVTFDITIIDTSAGVQIPMTGNNVNYS